jgi:hypothetical protein
MKTLIVRQVFHDPVNDDAVDLLTVRYKAAYAAYQGVVDQNTGLFMSGDRPSAAALRDEERAFDELDCARHALLDAAALAYPTIH